MLARKYRLPRPLFSNLSSGSEHRNSPNFTLRYKLEPGSLPHVAASVSKKVAKKAVDRNRVRRRVYASIKELIPQTKGGFYLIVAKPGSTKLKGESLDQELRQLLSFRN